MDSVDCRNLASCPIDILIELRTRVVAIRYLGLGQKVVVMEIERKKRLNLLDQISVMIDDHNKKAG